MGLRPSAADSCDENRRNNGAISRFEEHEAVVLCCGRREGHLFSVYLVLLLLKKLIKSNQTIRAGFVYPWRGQQHAVCFTGLLCGWR